MIATLESTGSSGTSSGTTSTGSDNAASSSNQTGGLDLPALAKLVMKEYTEAASSYAQTASVSVAA